MEEAEKTKVSRLAREIIVALPVELSLEQNIQLIEDYVQTQFVSAGMCTDVCIATERNKNTMIDIKQIKALSMREAEITETLTFAKKELDKTGSAVLPYSLYHALCEERKQIREQLEQMMK